MEPMVTSFDKTFIESAVDTSSWPTLPRDFTEDLLVEEELSPDRAIWREGISRAGFFNGTVLALSAVFIFARYPQHMWLLLLAGQVILPIRWYYHVVRYRDGTWFIVDLHWAVTCGMILYLTLVWGRVLDEFELEWGFRFTFMFSAGFLSCSASAYKSSLVLYSSERLTSFFIHVMPVVTLLALRTDNGFSAAVRLAWPSYFPEHVWRETEVIELLACAYMPYILWFVPYSVWLVKKGIDLPSQGYNTTFHEIYVKGGFKNRVLKKFNIESMRNHALVFLCLHFLFASCSFVFAILVWYYAQLHFVWAFGALLYSVWTGAGHFIEVTVKEFGHLVADQEGDCAARAAAIEQLHIRQGSA